MNKDPENENAKRKADEKKVTKTVDKKSMEDLSDEELNKVAGGKLSMGLWCEPGCEPILNGCYCDEESDW